MNKKVKIILSASLLLNVAFAGFFISDMMHVKHRRPESRMVRHFEERKNPQMEMIRQEQNIAWEMLKDKDFDRAAFESQTDRVITMREEMMKSFAMEMADKIRAMPEDERDEAVDRMMKRGPHGRQERMGDKQGHPDGKRPPMGDAGRPPKR